MKITEYGKDVIFKMFLITIMFDVSAFLINILLLKIILISISAILFLFTLYFFRDPERSFPENSSVNLIISPADGKIVLIEKLLNKDNNFFTDGVELIKISIFLSPFNVHVNRIPMTGIIKSFEYIKGDYIVAFDHKASEKNERTIIGIENQMGRKIIFKQIAGFVARRIVCKLRINDNVIRGERFGMIKFGSRTDILIKSDSQILVKMGQKVIAGITPIAEI